MVLRSGSRTNVRMDRQLDVSVCRSFCLGTYEGGSRSHSQTPENQQQE